MNVVPFKAEHFWAIDVQPSQRYALETVTPEIIAKLETLNSFACVDEDGKVLCCFGWIEIYPTRAMVWGYFDKDSGPRFIHITRVAKRMFEGLLYRRIEIEVDYDFEAGHRWAQMLGFTLEAERLRGFRIDGGDSAIYARIQ